MRQLFLFIALCSSLLSCGNRSSDDGYNPQLPPITQTGANTFGAIINGKVMVPRNSIGYIPPGSNHYAVSYSSLNNYEEIFATDGRSSMGAIYIYIHNDAQKYPIMIGTYNIKESNGAWSSSVATNTLITARIFNYKNSEYSIYLSLQDTGSITITKNNNNVFSGTFSCKLKNKDNPNDIIEIKDGRFDFNKNTINTTNFP